MASWKLWACAAGAARPSSKAAVRTPTRSPETALVPRKPWLIPVALRAREIPQVPLNSNLLRGSCPEGPAALSEGSPGPSDTLVTGPDEHEIPGLVPGKLDGRVLGGLLGVEALGGDRHVLPEPSVQLLAGEDAHIGPEERDKGSGEGRVDTPGRVENRLDAARGHDHARPFLRHLLHELQALRLTHRRLEIHHCVAREDARVTGVRHHQELLHVHD